MADCKFEKLIKAYTTATTLEERTLLDQAFQHILTERNHTAPNVYNEIYDWFTKQGVQDLDQPLVMTKPGLSPLYYPTTLPQGHHWAPMRHTHAKTTTWIAKNPIEVELKASKYGKDRPQFQTSQQNAIAMEADAFAFANSFDWWKMMVIGRLFTSKEEWKKIGACKADGSDGLRNELDAIYNPSDGGSNGYPSYQQGLSIQQNFMCFKDGDYTLCCKNEADCNPWKEKTNRIEKILEALQKCIASNKITTEPTKITGFTQKQGSEDYAKWVGLINTTKRTIKDMKTLCTSKFNICMDANNSAECCDAACSAELKKLGIILGCCAKCKDSGEEKCHCYNQTFASSDDLAIFANPQDVLYLEEAFPLIQNRSPLELSAGNLGVSRIFELHEIPSGTLIVMNRKTIGIHPVLTEYGSADYNETKLHNLWMTHKFHIVTWPYHCVTLSKAS